MKSIQSHKEKLFNKISLFLKRENKVKIISGIFISLIGTIILILIFSGLEFLNYFSPLVRSIIFISTFLVLFVLLFVLTSKELKNYIRSKSFSSIQSGAEQIGKRFPQIKDNLLNSLQILENNKNSIELSNAAFENVYSKASSLNFLETIDYSKLKKYLSILIFSIILFTTIFTFVTPMRDAALRIINFDKEFTKPLPFSLSVLTKDTNVKRDESITIQVKANGEIPNKITIATKASNQSEVKHHTIAVDSNNIFSLQIRNIKNPIKYFAQKDDVTTDTFEIGVTSSPILSFLNFEIIPPRYSGLSATTQENNGNIRSLKGTKVNFNINSSKTLLNANRVTSNSKIDSLLINMKSAIGNFRISKNEKYHFEIIDMDGNKNENPIQFSIEVIPDLFPEIEILHPDLISLIPANDIISINYNIIDDFGFSKAKLNYSKKREIEDDEQKFVIIELNISKDQIEQSLYYNWDVSRLGFKESDEISYFIEVFDNDVISGPKSTKTQIYKLRVPTLDELFTQAENVQEKALEDLTETLKEAEELKKELSNIKDELKQDDKKIEWNEKKRIEETAKKYEEISNKIEEVQEQLQKMQEQMTENNLLSEETMEKYNELQDLMDELNSEEMRKAMEDMQKSLEQLMRDKVQKSLDNLTMNEEMFQKSIERTLNLLKKIQIEQKIDEVIKRTEEIVENLEEISENTENSKEKENSSENQDLANEQNKIEEKLNSLQDELKKLNEKMSEVNDMPTNKMDEINKDFEEQQNQELSKDAKEQLQKQNPMEALKNQNQLSQNMKSMQDQLQQMQQQMQQQSQQMVMQNLLKAIDNILGLSKEQESLTNETKQARSNPNELPKMANQQMEIKQNLENILKQLSALSQKSFAITPEMGESLGKAQNNMNKSIAGMQNRNGQQSSANQGEAMSNLNEAAAMLQNSLQSMMQGGGQGSGGMMSMMQQLQQMGQQQMGLNKMTQMMQQGQLSMQQAQLQRLGKEQGAIQKSLSELNKEAREAGQSKKLGANLEEILEEMNEVISGLNTKKVDDNLIKSQEKILSKLLDAQRSINERDFEKNRESFSGQDFNLDSPSQLNLSNEQAKDMLREELLKSIKEGYSKDYEDLIRRYFENLNNSSNN